MVCESAISGNLHAAHEIADRTEVKNQRFEPSQVDIIEIKREKLTIAVQNGLNSGWNLPDTLEYLAFRGVSKEDLALVRGEDLVIPATRAIDSGLDPQAP